jgi:hypothetical protein
VVPRLGGELLELGRRASFIDGIGTDLNLLS